MRSMKMLSVAGAALVGSSAFAFQESDGWAVAADNRAEFSAKQGAGGWWYLFDRGEGTEVESMPYFTSMTGGGVTGWSTAQTIGTDGSVCVLGVDSEGNAQMHPNAPYSCAVTSLGLQRPLLRWNRGIPSDARVQLSAEWYTPSGHDARLILKANGVVLLDRTLAETGGQPIQAEFAIEDLETVELIEDPTSDGCGTDAVKIHLVVLTPDCDGNGIADVLEIADGTAGDVDLDGIPDRCQCTADVIENGVVDGADLSAVLAVWGTDGGLYPRADTNGDGVVDGQDLATVLGGWGPCGG